MSTAEKVAALFGNDGTCWETDDERTLDEVCQECGGTIEKADAEELKNPDLVPWRYVFDDGSAICYGEAGWDIEGSRPFLMAGLA
jgi:hypothetical protein